MEVDDYMFEWQFGSARLLVLGELQKIAIYQCTGYCYGYVYGNFIYELEQQKHIFQLQLSGC